MRINETKFNVFLKERRDEVIKKLEDRTGGVEYGTMRDKNTGKFSAQIPVTYLLREKIPEDPNPVPKKPNMVRLIKEVVDTASNVYSNFQLHKIQQSLNQLLSLQQLTLGVNVIGFAIILYKLDKMDKKLDKIFQGIEGIKIETFRTQLDKLKAILERVNKHPYYNDKEKDKDFDTQLDQITESVDMLKKYFERHSLYHINSEDFYDYLFFVVLCHLVQFRIDSIKEQNELAKENLVSVIRLIEKYSTDYLTLHPEASASAGKFLQLKRRINDYLFEFQYDLDVKNNIDRSDVRLIELEIDEVKEAYKKLSILEKY